MENRSFYTSILMPLAFYAIYLFDCKNEDTHNIVQLLELSNRIPQHKC